MNKYPLMFLLIISLLIFIGCNDDQQQLTEQTPPIDSIDSVPVPTTDNAVNNPPVANETNAAKVEFPDKSFSWYFTRNKQHLASAINNDAADMLAQNQAIYLLPNDSKKVFLTFDCGYELGYTPAILDILQRQQIKAAFFITGHYIESQPELVKRMQAEGHLVCNHTWNHPDLSTIGQDKLKQEINRLDQTYQELTGVTMDKYIRPPMGNYSFNSLKWTAELGYTSVFWSMAWKDWDPQQQPGADFVYQHVMDYIHPGAIILMHAVSSSDTDALERIITDLQAQGYVFSTF